MKKKNKKKKILVIHGPNLHLLGKREKNIYGTFTLEKLNRELRSLALKKGLQLETFQSNSEGKIVEKLSASAADFLIINPAAYTHTSVAIRDAILATGIPAIEVHISNVFKREAFRKKSLISDIVIGTITGLGKLSYITALDAAAIMLTQARRP